MRQNVLYYKKNNNLKSRKYKHNYLILIYILFYIKKQFFINKNR